MAAPNTRLAVQPGIVWVVDEAASMVEAWTAGLDPCQRTVVRVVATEEQLRNALGEFGSESFAADLGRLGIESLPFGLAPRIVVVGCLDGSDRARQWERIEEQAEEAGSDLSRGATIHHVVLIDPSNECLNDTPPFPQLKRAPWVIGARNNVKLAIDRSSRQSLLASLLDALLFAEYASDCPPLAAPFRSSDGDAEHVRFIGYPRLNLTDLGTLLAQRLESAIEKSLADSAMTNPPTEEVRVRFRRTVEEFCAGAIQFDAMKEQLFGPTGIDGWEPSALAKYGETWSRELLRALDQHRTFAPAPAVSVGANTLWGRFCAWLKRLCRGPEAFRPDREGRSDQEIQWLRQRLLVVAQWSYELRHSAAFEATIVSTDLPRYATLHDAIADHLQRAIATGSTDSSWRNEVRAQANALTRENFFRLLEWAAPACAEAADFLAAIENKTLLRWSGLTAAEMPVLPQGGVMTAGTDDRLAAMLPVPPTTLRVCGSCRPFLLLASQPVPFDQVRS